MPVPSAYCAPLPLAPIVVGGFDVPRGGLESLGSPSEAGLGAAIVAGFGPNTTFVLGNTINDILAGNPNAIIIGVAYASQQGIVPLSNAEQGALYNWVETPTVPEHVLVVLADNEDQFQAASNSLLRDWKIHSTGVLSNGQTADFVPVVPSNPVMQGPCGIAAQLDTSWPGWFNKLPLRSTVLANLAANNMPALAYIPSNRFGSGSAVFFSDSSLMIDSARTANDLIAIGNALALY